MNLFNIFLRLKTSRLKSIMDVEFLSPNERIQTIEKNIFIYWNEGENLAPELVKLCINSWRILNPGWSITVLDKHSADNVLPRKNLPSDITEASYSDLLRLHLLKVNGGVWADATTLCLKPLDHWLHFLLLTTDIFLFSNPAADRKVASWFIASRKRSHGLRIWKEKSLEYWTNISRQPSYYFWLHYLFQYLFFSSRDFKAAFKNMPKISASPHHALCYAMRTPHSDSNDLIRFLQMTNIQKLSYKHNYNAEDISKLLKEAEFKSIANISNEV